ncbi:MAG TPA: peptidase S51 [Vicinamibacteria bacterium]|nr:peptidase S51 [Vicinamibacteria bacterium]
MLGTLAAVAALAAPAEAKVTRYLTGNPADVSPPLFGPAHALGGGGTDVDEALQWLIDQVRGCTGCPATVDVVVLRASGADGYNEYIYGMNGVDSVETLVITRARDADTAAVEAVVRNAEVVFFAGGDQCSYVENFKGTAVELAVESVYARGGGVGGTSAGLAVQSEFVFDACRGTILSEEALEDPYDRRVSFTYDLFDWAHLDGIVAESHFTARDRMGRAMVFAARQIQDGRAQAALAVAVDEATSLVVDRGGVATVIGEGAAYFILADHPPEVCQPRTPLTYSNYKIWRVEAGGRFNLRNRPSAGYYRRSVDNGVITADPY